MPVDKDAWFRRKEEFRKRLFEDLEIGYLDRDILDILRKLFEFEDVYTISSCSGRITLLDALMPWHRKGSTILFKKHTPIEFEEIKPYMNVRVVNRLWLVVTGPIIHASTLNISAARKLLRIGRKAGMKHSGILSFSVDKGFIVELKTGVRIANLIKTKDETVVKDDRTLQYLVEISNEALLEGKEKLNRLRVELGLKPIDYSAFLKQRPT